MNYTGVNNAISGDFFFFLILLETRFMKLEASF